MSVSGNHIQTIAALALGEGVEEAGELSNFAGVALQSLLHGVLQSPMRISLKALRAQESFLGVAEIHPAWLVESLKRESPRVIGVILRHLPSSHVRYLLEHLPRRTVLKLPKLVEAFYVTSEILQVVRKRFERSFIPMRISHQIEHFEFTHLYYLKIEELERLMDQLGLSELGLALVHASKKVLRGVVHRFGIGEGREILARVKKFQGEPVWFTQDARYSVLAQKGKGQGTKSFLRELGFLSLAKSFGSGDAGLFEALKQKLAPPEAYLLKRYLEEQPTAFTPLALKQVSVRQAWVLNHLRQLCKNGKIDPLWMESLKAA